MGGEANPTLLIFIDDAETEKQFDEFLKKRIAESPAHPIILRLRSGQAQLPEIAHTRGGKYYIATQPALPRHPLLGKFAIDRSDQCISCGHCVEACIYGVHFRNPRDLSQAFAAHP